MDISSYIYSFLFSYAKIRLREDTVGDTALWVVRGKMAAISHSQQVCRLYRKSLKHLLSWTVRRDVWRQEAVLLRAWFDQNKDVTNMREAKQQLAEGEKIFWEYQHPEPYISKF